MFGFIRKPITTRVRIFETNIKNSTFKHVKSEDKELIMKYRVMWIPSVLTVYFR